NLYRNRNDFEPDRIIDAIVKAGGIENIDLTFHASDFYDDEAIKAIRFLKNINYDINKLPIDQYEEVVAIELIKQGYDMYKTGRHNIPVITECGYGVLEECIEKGLDLNKFNHINHFMELVECDEKGEYLKKNYRISNFIRDKEKPKFIDIKKLDLLIDNG
ncbi:hypothetical protein, partial [Enterobacter hormaechei]|uniref:hypothetical protein n=1 Tax=Enterobacter hormaechei TaxID=158836 RepID=UPI0013D004E8